MTANKRKWVIAHCDDKMGFVCQRADNVTSGSWECKNPHFPEFKTPIVKQENKRFYQMIKIVIFVGGCCFFCLCLVTIGLCERCMKTNKYLKETAIEEI